MVLSTWLDEWIDLPVSGERFESELRKRLATGKQTTVAGGQVAAVR